MRFIRTTLRAALVQADAFVISWNKDEFAAAAI